MRSSGSEHRVKSKYFSWGGNRIAVRRSGVANGRRGLLRLGVSLVTTPEFREHPKVADAASELLVSVFGADKTSTRLVLGMASLPVGVCVVLETIFEIGS